VRDKFKEMFNQLQEEIEELEKKRDIDIDTVRQVLALSRDIYGIYQKAPDGLKRHLLGLFWEKFFVKDKKSLKSYPQNSFRL